MYIYQPVHINTRPNSNEDLIMMGSLKIVSKNEGMINEVSCFVLLSGLVSDGEFKIKFILLIYIKSHADLVLGHGDYHRTIM